MHLRKDAIRKTAGKEADMITVTLIFVAIIAAIMAIMYILAYIIIFGGLALFNKFLDWLNS